MAIVLHLCIFETINKIQKVNFIIQFSFFNTFSNDIKKEDNSKNDSHTLKSKKTTYFMRKKKTNDQTIDDDLQKNIENYR